MPGDGPLNSLALGCRSPAKGVAWLSGSGYVPEPLAFAPAVMALVLVFFTSFFQSLPEAIRAAIALIAVHENWQERGSS